MSTESNRIIIYHNPRCSKSRKALQLLRDSGVEPRVIEYLKTPPTQSELEQILELLYMQPRDLIRTKEAEYTASGLDNPDVSRQTLIRAMLEHPKLIERPIVLGHGKAALGRPPEQVLEILS